MTLFIAKFRHAQSFAQPTELWHQQKQKKSHSIKSNSQESGTTRNRTRDTRPNLDTPSPLLYQLSYGTNKNKKRVTLRKSNSQESGTTRNRTGDTRIFSPLLYQLSYGTILTSNIKLDVSFAGAKVALYFETCKYFGNFLSKKQKKSRFTLSFHPIILPLQEVKEQTNRDLAQLVAHYVRDVGVGRSSRLIPTILWQIKSFIYSAMIAQPLSSF